MYLVYIPNPEMEGVSLKPNIPPILYNDVVTYSKIISSIPGNKRGEKSSVTKEVTVGVGLNDLSIEDVIFLQEHERAKDRFELGIYRVVEPDSLEEGQEPTGTLKDYSLLMSQLLIANSRHKDMEWLKDNARSDPRPEIRKKCDQKIQFLRQTMTGAA